MFETPRVRPRSYLYGHQSTSLIFIGAAMFKMSFPQTIASVCIVLSAAGCSGRDLPETVPVTGTITFKGEPLANAEVAFVPKGNESAVHPARGRTDETGVYTLQTYFGPQDLVSGATPGEYVVTVEKRDVPPDPAELQKMFQEHPQMVPNSLLPDKYSSLKTSGLEATVTNDGENSFTFELTE